MILELRPVKDCLSSAISATPNNETGKYAAGAFIIIQSLIESYEESYNPKFLYDALQFIECIEISSLTNSFSGIFNNPEMRQFLIESGSKVLTRPHQSKAIRDTYNMRYALPRSAEKTLGNIYVSIANRLSEKQAAWYYPFPTNERNEITNSEILEWQQYMTSQPADLTLAHRDFTRDTGIGNDEPASLKSDADVNKALTEFVDRSSYKENEKTVIKAWLSARGGQEMNAFISHMIKHQATFLVPKYQPNPDEPAIEPSMRANANINKWTLDKEGHATFNLNYQVKSIQYGHMMALLKCQDGGIRMVSTESDEFETSNKKVNYIASIACKVKLEINSEGHVVPKVTSLVVASYTNQLMPPSGTTPAENYTSTREHRGSASF